jgi:hypothetical protein
LEGGSDGSSSTVDRIRLKKPIDFFFFLDGLLDPSSSTSGMGVSSPGRVGKMDFVRGCNVRDSDTDGLDRIDRWDADFSNFIILSGRIKKEGLGRKL